MKYSLVHKSYRIGAIAMLATQPFIGRDLSAAGSATIASPALNSAVKEGIASPVMKVNRLAPVTDSPAGFTLSDNPTDDEITQCGLLSDALVPMASATDRKDNSALAAALKRYANRSEATDVSALVEFCVRYPESRWRVAVLDNLAKLYYFHGYYSKALTSWEEAWKSGKDAREVSAMALVNQTFTELGRMNARLGRTSRLDALLKEAANRQFLGGPAEAVVDLKDALALMQHDPQHSFRCGPLALAEIRESQHISDAGDQKVATAESTSKGCSLVQVAELAAVAGMKYQLAKRDPGSVIITPAVIHWKLGHYAALVSEKSGRYLAKDLTFRDNLWLSREAIDAEASGFFLVPAGPLPQGWHALSPADVADVWGCGQTNSNEPGGEGGGDPDCGCKNQGGNNGNGTPGGLGMAHYDVKAQAVSLTIFDTPVGYQAPVGPATNFTVRYEQRADGQPAIFTFSNIGSNWFHDWMAYVVDDPTNPGADVTLFPPGGGYYSFTGYDSSTQSYALELVSNTTLVITSPTSYECRFPDGSKEVFAQPNNINGRGRQVFLSQIVDAQGNALTFKYDGKYRLVAVTDAIGQVTTLTYGLKADPLKITKVTDPFGRSATLTYASVNGTFMLTSTTDVMGITSSYEYDGGLVHRLTTPYGKTTLLYAQNFGDIGTGRSVDIYDPENGHQRVEYNQNVNYPNSDSSVPSGMNLFNAYLNYRDTFYWDQHAMEEAPYVYSQAKVFHFQHTPDGQSTSRLLESIGQPLESRIWMNYPGQGQSAFSTGVYIGKPSLVGRMVSTGANLQTQLSQYSYNALSNITSYTDPAGRITQYTYAPNNIDVVQVQHYNGSSYDTVTTSIYNGQHLPKQITDAAGQITTIKYNSFGEVTSVTDPKSKTTIYTYDNDGYLQKITDALGNIQASYSYDGYGRIRTYTDVNGFTTTYSYDNLDRLTEILYPDQTTDAFKYTAMSLVKWTDRLARDTHYQYNSLQQLITVLDPEGHQTQYNYCACGALTGITDGNGNNTTFIRDTEDRVIQKIYADKTIVNLGYDLGGRLSTVYDAKQQTTVYQYGVDDLLQQISYSAQTPSVSVAYDAYGRIASMSDGIGSTSYSYVPAGQLGALLVQSETKPAGYGTVVYQYDQLSRLVSESIDGVDTRNWNYDSIGRISTQANGLGNFTYGFSGSSDLLRTLAEPSQQFKFSYYPANGDFRLREIQQLSGSTTVSNKYTYDPVGNILNWDQQNPADGKAAWNLRYDADNEIRKVTSQVSSGNSGLNLGTSRFTDDPGANLTKFTTNSSLKALASAIYTINSLNQVSSISGADYAGSLNYDANGNSENGVGLPSENPNTVTGARTYGWDGANRLNQIIYGSGSNSTSLSYDGFGRVVEIVETVNGSVESDRRYVWIGDKVVEQRNAQGTVMREYFDQGFTDSGAVYYYGPDHLGSVRNLTDASGTIQAQLDYGLYGEVTGVSGSIQPDFAYTGLFYHQRSGLYFAEYRVYDSALKRWLNRDPIAEAGGINLYAYVLNNPVNLTDPTGHQATCDGKPKPKPTPTPTPSPKPAPKKPNDPNKSSKDKGLQLLKDLANDGFTGF
jgi:RHS repeat-associated protein